MLSLLLLALLSAGLLVGWRWLRAHPEHDPFAPFDLAQPRGWATHRKLVGLAGEDEACFAVFDRAGERYARREQPNGRNFGRLFDRANVVHAEMRALVGRHVRR